MSLTPSVVSASPRPKPMEPGSTPLAFTSTSSRRCARTCTSCFASPPLEMLSGLAASSSPPSSTAPPSIGSSPGPRRHSPPSPKDSLPRWTSEPTRSRPGSPPSSPPLSPLSTTPPRTLRTGRTASFTPPPSLTLSCFLVMRSSSRTRGMKTMLPLSASVTESPSSRSAERPLTCSRPSLPSWLRMPMRSLPSPPESPKPSPRRRPLSSSSPRRRTRRPSRSRPSPRRFPRSRLTPKRTSRTPSPPSRRPWLRSTPSS
mmetsp:Transcript_14418/g.26583  ORF Transcript_14418/g.26583 Transcript_14418/m.26583 type:complete len:258 (+) Transcript_14418:3072-3845(+)